MKLAHTADWHLGFRQFYRATASGQNQREMDGALALQRLVDDLLAQRPDLIVVAGDVFHSIRPTNAAILTAFHQLQRLRAGLPETPVIMCAGNHDTPRDSEFGVILPLYRALGIDVAVFEPVQFKVPGATVTAVPSAAARRIPTPDPAAALNILVLHAGVAGFSGPAPRDAADPDALERAGWDYVALGDYHVCSQVGPRAWYSGSIEFTATDPWGEMRKRPEKGWLLVDLPGGTPAFRPIAAPRRFVDLAPIDAIGMGAADLDAALAARMAETEIAGVVARLLVTNVAREVKRALNQAPIRAWKAAALNLNLELRAPASVGTVASRAAMHESLDTIVARFLGERQLPPDVDRARMVEMGKAYLAGAGSLPDPYTGESIVMERSA